MDTITATPTQTGLIDLVARAAIDAKVAQRAADKGWADAEAVALETFQMAHVTTVLVPQVDGTKTRVTLEGLNESRTTVDLGALADLIPASVLDSIVKVSLDMDKFKAAVTAGVIPAKVAEMVTTTKPVKPSVRITFNAKET